MCHHHHCCCPRYWCGTCGRYTHSQHHHGAWNPFWSPPPRPQITVVAQQRDRLTIKALGGSRV